MFNRTLMPTRRLFTRMLAGSAAASGLAPYLPARADEGRIRIGVMGDLSGYSMEIGGPGAVLATRMAVEDHAAKAAGLAVDVVQADFLNKPDLATQIARRWFDVEGVDVVTDLPNTPTALAVARLGKETSHIILAAEAATPELTTGQCSPMTMHIADDTNALAAGTAKALLERGLKTWFFITADFGFGQVCATLANIHRRDGQEIFRPDDFMPLLRPIASHPDRHPESPAPDPQAQSRLIAALLGKKE